MLQLTCYSHSPLCASGHNNDGDGAVVGGGSNGSCDGEGSDGGVAEEDGASNINDNTRTHRVHFLARTLTQAQSFGMLTWWCLCKLIFQFYSRYTHTFSSDFLCFYSIFFPCAISFLCIVGWLDGVFVRFCVAALLMLLLLSLSSMNCHCHQYFVFVFNTCHCVHDFAVTERRLVLFFSLFLSFFYSFQSVYFFPTVIIVVFLLFLSLLFCLF